MNHPKSRMVRARRQHDCSECGGVIKFGETYQRTHGADTGTFWTCPMCAQIQAKFNREFVHKAKMGCLLTAIITELPFSSDLLGQFRKNPRRVTQIPKAAPLVSASTMAGCPEVRKGRNRF